MDSTNTFKGIKSILKETYCKTCKKSKKDCSCGK